MMKHFLILLLLTKLTITYGQTTYPYLFPIIENNRTGFIDSTGRIVIKPIFRTAGAFSEGLAYARIDGTYGYIDTTGKFVIQPQYDYATPFNDGLAVVYKDKIPVLITKQGNKAFETNYVDIGRFAHGMARATTTTGKMGVINKNGKLIVDTAFKRIDRFVQGMAVVFGINNPSDEPDEKVHKRNYKVGVIDTQGRFIIPFGVYSYISDFSDGYFRVDIPAEPWDTIDRYTEQTGFIDKTGKLVLAKDHRNHCSIDGDMRCGLAKMKLNKYWLPKGNNPFSTENKYAGFINIHGEIVINDTTYMDVFDFSDNRAFVVSKGYDYFIINTQGKIISKDTFSGFIMNGFINGFAFVEKNGAYGMIDTNGNFLIKPQFKGIDEMLITDGSFIYYCDKSRDEPSIYRRHFGIAKLDGTVILDPIMQDFDINSFQNGLLRCTIKRKLTYINKDGKIVWQEPEVISWQPTNKNIDFKSAVDYVASSKNYKNSSYSDLNLPKHISKSNHFPENAISVVVHPEMKGTIKGLYNGIKVFVSNTTKNNVDFNSWNNCLLMTVQAKNRNSEWEDIEYLEQDFCGENFNVTSLEKMNYWSFVTPVYEGEFKTKLRIKLMYIDPLDKSEDRWNKQEIVVFSNEYDGSINPGQFWVKEKEY